MVIRGAAAADMADVIEAAEDGRIELEVLEDAELSSNGPG